MYKCMIWIFCISITRENIYLKKLRGSGCGAPYPFDGDYHYWRWIFTSCTTNKRPSTTRKSRKYNFSYWFSDSSWGYLVPIYFIKTMSCFCTIQSNGHMQKWIEQMKKAFEHAYKNKLEGIVFLGECNARHWSWGDSKYSSHAQILHDNLINLITILNDGQPTFLSKNGKCNRPMHSSRQGQQLQ